MGKSYSEAASNATENQDNRESAIVKPIRTVGTENISRIEGMCAYVYSNESLPDLVRRLEKYGRVCLGLSKIIRKDGKDSSGTIVIMDRDTFISASGSEEFRTIREYKVILNQDDENVDTLFLVVPEILKGLADEVNMLVENMMKLAAYWGIIPDNCWDIQAKIVDRNARKLGSGVKIGLKASPSQVKLLGYLLSGNLWPVTSDSDKKVPDLYMRFSKYKPKVYEESTDRKKRNGKSNQPSDTEEVEEDDEQFLTQRRSSRKSRK